MEELTDYEKRLEAIREKKEEDGELLKNMTPEELAEYIYKMNTKKEK